MAALRQAAHRRGTCATSAPASGATAAAPASCSSIASAASATAARTAGSTRSTTRAQRRAPRTPRSPAARGDPRAVAVLRDGRQPRAAASARCASPPTRLPGPPGAALRVRVGDTTTSAARAPSPARTVTLGRVSATTDASGRASLRCGPAAGTYALVPTAPGHDPVVSVEGESRADARVGWLALGRTSAAVTLAACGVGAGGSQVGSATLTVTPRLRRAALIAGARASRSPRARR